MQLEASAKRRMETSQPEPTYDQLREQIAQLQEQNARLRAENTGLKQRFAAELKGDAWRWLLWESDVARDIIHPELGAGWAGPARIRER